MFTKTIFKEKIEAKELSIKICSEGQIEFLGVMDKLAWKWLRKLKIESIFWRQGSDGWFLHFLRVAFQQRINYGHRAERWDRSQIRCYLFFLSISDHLQFLQIKIISLQEPRRSWCETGLFDSVCELPCGKFRHRCLY